MIQMLMRNLKKVSALWSVRFGQVLLLEIPQEFVRGKMFCPSQRGVRFREVPLYLDCRLVQAHYVLGIFSHIHKLKHIDAYLPTFEYILADSGIFRILAQLDILMYIKAYSEPMAYSGIFITIDIFSQFQTRYSSITQEQFMHILYLIWADSGMFTTLAYIGT